jgi:hypothetical protein
MNDIQKTKDTGLHAFPRDQLNKSHGGHVGLLVFHTKESGNSLAKIGKSIMNNSEFKVRDC